MDRTFESAHPLETLFDVVCFSHRTCETTKADKKKNACHSNKEQMAVKLKSLCFPFSA